jgi:hypothetical protein
MGFSTSPLYPDSGTADALKINGTPVSGAKPANGQTLVYSSSIDEYVPQAVTPANIGAVAKTGDTLTGTLDFLTGALFLTNLGDTELENTFINYGGITLNNGAGISFGGVGDAAARASLRTQIGAEPTITTLPLSKGGTGATTAAAALAALGGVGSNITGLTGATQITNTVQITQAGYNAIVTPATGTLYIIVG